MKYLLSLITVLSFSLCFMSCSKEQTEENPFIGVWTFSEVHISTTTYDPLVGDSLYFSVINDGSTLEINIMDEQVAELTGDLKMKMNVTLGDANIHNEDLVDTYNENRTWNINPEGEFEFVASEDFKTATLEGDRIVFNMDELLNQDLGGLFAPSQEGNFEMIFTRK